MRISHGLQDAVNEYVGESNESPAQVDDGHREPDIDDLDMFGIALNPGQTLSWFDYDVHN